MLAILGLIICLGLTGVVLAATWPTKSINIIVPWNPGGASDLTARTLGVEMEKVLKQRISVTNTPGASGAIGTQASFDAAHDGYTWSANADGSIVTYQILGLLKFSHKEYSSFLAIFTPNVICVPAHSPIKDIPALIETMKRKTVTVGSAGVGSGGHIAAETFKKYTKVTYRHVPYQGGAPAVTATVKGEIDAVMQLSMEVTEMLRAKQLKALAVMDAAPLEVAGYGVIQPITKWIPEFAPLGQRFGLFMPKNISDAVMQKIIKAFKSATKSESVKKFASQRGCKVCCLYGAKADRNMNESASRSAWLLYETGVAKVSPAEYNIAKP
jgi:tripartite-type tricarboxylate transporter receptor subunit TctC